MSLPEMSIKDLQVYQRFGVGREKLTPVLVRFYDIQNRHLAWDNKTNLKGTGITISEFLIITRHKIFLKTIKYFGLKNCWISDSKIVIMLPDKRRCKIEIASGFQKQTAKYPLKDYASEPLLSLLKFFMIKHSRSH